MKIRLILITLASLLILSGIVALFVAGMNYGWWKRHTQVTAPEHYDLAVPLTRGSFTLKVYSPGENVVPKALIIFGSGDGGWKPIWEDRVASYLSSQGYAVAGIDFKTYSVTDYSEKVLGKDTQIIAAAMRKRFGAPRAPLVLAGFSMGAIQAVPQAAYILTYDPAGSEKLAGLLVCAPGERGRYGLRTADTLDIEPTGPNTFAITDFSKKLGQLRIAQFQGGGDVLSSTAWLNGLAAPHRLWKLPNGFHSFSGASDKFLGQLTDGLNWILGGFSQ
ncbi:MAG: AcvB/VirJ family lysyl-phosphatidylglycerol hydrolase [Spartobacteria bacterium]